MNYLRLFGFLFLGVIFSQQTKAQISAPKNFKLFVNLENAPFDSLYLHDYSEGRHIFLIGEKIGRFTWKVTIPDSIESNSETIMLMASRYSAEGNSYTMIRFVAKRADREVIVANVGVDGETSYLNGRYLHRSTFTDQAISVTKNNKDTVVIGSIVCEDFDLTENAPQSDIVVRSEDPFFSWFMDADGNRAAYQDHLAAYIELSRRYPDSRYLIINLASNLNKYRSKGDIQKIYENFSGSHSNTIWAKKIERFLYEKKFQNSYLPELQRKNSEKIVQDTSKYNLIVFTASWCVPCREEIPLLKEIYLDLGKQLVLTYISIDKPEGIPAYRKLVLQERIPWRSLLAFKDISGIKLKYFVETIPHVMLVHPDQRMEIIDVRKDSDLAKLYALVKPQTKKN